MMDSKLTQIKVSRLFKKNVEDERKSFLVIGGGRFGGSLAKTLSLYGKDVVLIDKDQDVVNSWKSEIDNIQKIDATKEWELKSIELKNFSNFIISLGSDINASFVTVLNITRERSKYDKKFYISVKSSTREQTQILEKLGVDNIISTLDVAQRKALELLYENVRDAVKIGEEFVLGHVDVLNESLVNMTYSDFEKKHDFKVRFITSVSGGDQKFIGKNQCFEIGTTVHFVSEMSSMQAVANEISTKVTSKKKSST